MNILHVVPSFYPATRWGGPIFSTLALCNWAAAQPDLEVRVITTNAAGPARSDQLSLPERRVPGLAGYPISYHRRVAGHSIAPRLLAELPAALRWADVVHLTGTYSFPSLPTLTLARIMGRPVVWSPRGAIQAAHEWPGAPRQGIKRKFEKLASCIAATDTVMLVTSESEARATAERMPNQRVKVISNSVELPSDAALERRSWRPEGRLRLLFLSRVHEKKGVDMLIDVVSRFGPEVELDIFGTGTDEYIRLLHERTAANGLEKRVRFHRHVDSAGKTEAFRNADLFVLPSYSENFGIAIAEALAHGVPVVTTDHTPWTDLDARGCGRCVSLETESVANGIADLMSADLATMGARGRSWMREKFSSDHVNRGLVELYAGLVAARGKENSA